MTHFEIVLGSPSESWVPRTECPTCAVDNELTFQTRMTIIVFLVDTSASMQQRAFVSGRSTLLDIAKGAVEFFVKLRQKSPGN